MQSHWNAYTAGLARDAKARKAAEPAPADAVEEHPTSTGEPAPEEPKPARKKRGPAAAEEGDPATT